MLNVSVKHYFIIPKQLIGQYNFGDGSFIVAQFLQSLIMEGKI